MTAQSANEWAESAGPQRGHPDRRHETEPRVCVQASPVFSLRLSARFGKMIEIHACAPTLTNVYRFFFPTQCDRFRAMAKPKPITFPPGMSFDDLLRKMIGTPPLGEGHQAEEETQ